MGICPYIGVGSQEVMGKDFMKSMKKAWGVKELATSFKDSMYDVLEEGNLKNIFIFGEDPMGCASKKTKVAGWLSVADFVVVQDYFMTETAIHAHLILPASFPVESGGSFTNTQKVIQEFDAQFTSKVERKSYEQLLDLLKLMGSKEKSDDLIDIRMEALSLLPINGSGKQLKFVYSLEDNRNRMFEYGCDTVNLRFETDFKKAFEN